MLLKSITLCCLMLNVQTQNSYFQRDSLLLNPGFIYPPDGIPVLPLSIPNLNELDKNAQRRVHQNESPINKQLPATVEIQKSVGSEFGSTDEQVLNNYKWNNFNKQISTSTTPSRKTSLLDPFLSHVSPIRQTALQKAQYGQKNPDISHNMSEPNWPTIHQISLRAPSSSQTGQDKLRAPQTSQGGQSTPEISLSRPSVAVPQNSLDRPTGPQTQFNPTPSDFNFPTEQAPGFNSLLHSVTNFGINLLKVRAPSSTQTGQDRLRVPQTSQGGQSTPEISLSRPSVAVPQNSVDRPTGPQTQFNATPSDFNYPTEQAPGFNSLLYSVTNFGIHLLKTIETLHSGNIVVSPFSITSLLALLQQGASGQTQAQITSALHMPVEATAPAYAKVSEEIRARNSRNILRVANNLFLSEDFFIDKNFKNVAINSFNSDVTNLAFQRAREAARQINSWVASRTDNQIQNLIAPDALDYTTQMVLVNAIYFKGLWEVPFRVEATLPREFYLSNGQSKPVQFMRMRKMFKTGIDKTSNAKVIVLPFERDEYHLIVILPNELMGMRNTLASLTDARLLNYLNFGALDTELELPKFTIRADTDLTVVLKTMGITNMFRRDYSELNGIGAYGAHSPTISSAVHSATLSIDEKGGTAAAATAFAAVALSYDEASVEFKVNRPFIAVLWDNKSSLPLFMAKIEDPQQ